MSIRQPVPRAARLQRRTRRDSQVPRRAAAGLSGRPALPDVVIRRAGAEERIGAGFQRGRVVEVVAGPGYGKTTAAWAYAAGRAGTVDWLTLGSDTTAEELRYALTTVARSRGATHLLVLDNAGLANTDSGLTDVLSAFLTGQSGGLDVLLLTTEHLGPVTGELVLRGECDIVDRRALLLTEEDAAQLIAEIRPDQPVDAGDLVARTEGWIAGAAMLARLGLEAAMPPSPVLVSYVEIRVLAAVPLDEQELLLAGSLLDRLPLDDVAGLLGRAGEALWYRLRARDVPMLTPSADALSYGELLSACLQEILPRQGSTRLRGLRGPRGLRGLRRRFALHLSMTGRYDEAVDWCVRSGDPGLAVEVLDAGLRSLPDLGAVSDRVGRWLRVIGEPYLLTSDVLTACVIRSFHAERRIDQAVGLIHRLETDGRMDNIVAVDPGVVGVVLWSLHSRPGEAAHYAEDLRDGHRADAVRFMLAATSGAEPAIPPLSTRWLNMAPVVHWGMLWQGRVDEILGAVGSPDADDNPNVVLSAVWQGRADVAEEVWQRIPELRRTRPHAVFARAALEIARGDTGAALRMLRSGADAARSTGGQNHHEVLASFATLKKGSPLEAVAALRPGLVEMDGVERRAITEWARLVLGLALLDLDRPREAFDVLAPAVRSMRRARRHLLLTAASCAFAESALRIGDSDAAATAVAEGRDQAGRAGSSYWTDEALLHCPNLRRSGILDRAAEGAAQSVTTATRTAQRRPERVELRPFQEPPLLVIDGVESSARRMKVVELIADLAVHPDGVDRGRLQERLFPDVGRSRGGNHFRQITYRLHELVGVRLDRREPALVVWPADIDLVAADRVFEESVVRARGETDAALADLRKAVDLAPGGYLSGSDLAWVEERRVYLSVLYEEAATKLLWAAVEAGDLDLVRQYGARALEFNPFSEEIYGLLMRAEHLGGNRAGAMAVYRRAHSALEELGLEPGPELRRLAQAAGTPRSPRRPDNAVGNGRRRPSSHEF